MVQMNQLIDLLVISANQIMRAVEVFVMTDLCIEFTDEEVSDFLNRIDYPLISHHEFLLHSSASLNTSHFKMSRC